MFKVLLLVQPQIDLGKFTALIRNVNAIDMKRLPPHGKFGEAVDELLDREVGEKHLFYGFYFEMPYNTMLEAQNFPHYGMFRLSMNVEMVMCKGVMTGPLDLWRLFCEWGKEHHLILPFVKALENVLPCR